MTLVARIDNILIVLLIYFETVVQNLQCRSVVYSS